jgi:hypothetical protein
MTDDLDPDSAKAKLEINARGYHYDPSLDPIADLIEQGPAACAGVHPKLLDLASIHRDFRDQYRRAVAAGAIPDDRTPDPHQEN